MSSDPMCAVQHYYTTVDEQSAEDVVALFTADATYRRPGYQPMVGTNALMAFYGGERVIVSGRHTITNIVVDGDRVAVEGQFNGVLRHDSQVEVKFSDFFVLADNLIHDRNTYFDAPAV